MPKFSTQKLLSKTFSQSLLNATRLTKLGKLVANDDASYQYLAQSIRMHPDQDTLKAMMLKGGFAHVDYHNLSGGVVALHVGIKC